MTRPPSLRFRGLTPESGTPAKPADQCTATPAGSAVGSHTFQGRFKFFPVQEDDPFFTVWRYVVRNSLRADLAARASCAVRP
jgi:hypothetical protein